MAFFGRGFLDSGQFSEGVIENDDHPLDLGKPETCFFQAQRIWLFDMWLGQIEVPASGPTNLTMTQAYKGEIDQKKHQDGEARGNIMLGRTIVTVRKNIK